jgi:hypothetical protein
VAFQEKALINDPTLVVGLQALGKLIFPKEGSVTDWPLHALLKSMAFCKVFQ